MISLKKLQNWMKKNDKDIFLINRSDEFLSEYIAEYAERVKWVSGFSGSAGKVVVEKNKAYIFVDGRYTNQVRKQVNPKFYTIKHFNDYWNHLKEYKKEKLTLSIDATLHSIAEIEKIKLLFNNSNTSLDFIKANPIDLLWKNQPAYPFSKAFIHKEKYSGESSLKKINKIQKILKKNSINFYILNSLDSIAWLLNIRGNDVQYTPLLLCYLIIPNKGKVELFIDEKKIKNIKRGIKNYVNFHSFDNIDKFILNLNIKDVVGVDVSETPYHFKNLCLSKKIKIKGMNNPSLYPKAIKNSTELLGAKKANIRDGVSISKFLYWLKNEVVYSKTDEIKAADYLFKLRKRNKLFYSLSFDTISAIGSHAALPHYRVTKKSNLGFAKNSIYLVDSGAQYKDGTTDITRTIILGRPTEEQKDRFTRVLKGHIALACSKFSTYTKGSELDILARKSLNEIGCDYDHGTGHGIGSFLSVHEGPQRISKSQGQSDGLIKPGMILSNEPGYYKEGEYGIRIENLVICSFRKKNSLFFDTISWAPIDIDLIDVSLLDTKEKVWINAYHKKVYKNIKLGLNQKEQKWLYKVTRPL